MLTPLLAQILYHMYYKLNKVEDKDHIFEKYQQFN